MEIRTRSSFLMDVLRDVAAGKLVPASFQRPYVWRRPDVEAFWTSITKEWPIGSILIWEPDASVDVSRAGRTRLGPIEPAGEPKGIILDGQNRLATFAWSLRMPGDPMPDPSLLSEAEAEVWGSKQLFVFDTHERRSRFAHEDEVMGDHLIVPAGIVHDSTKLWPFIRKREKQIDISDEAITWLDHFGKAVRSAQCTTTILDRASPADAFDAFRHIARVGVPMSEQDFADAMAWALEDAPAAPSL